MELLDKYKTVIEPMDPIKYTGRISRVRGLLMESQGPQAILGELCHIHLPDRTIPAEVVGLDGTLVQLMAFEEAEGIEIGSRVTALGEKIQIPVSDQLLGRVIDCLGKPLDSYSAVSSAHYYSLFNTPPTAMERDTIRERIVTGVRAIDGLLPLGKGQRLGIFAGSGVGKSTLLGMIARNTSADVNVVALIGERGREVREFIESDLGPEGLARSVLVVSTSDTTPLTRLRGAYTAMAVAEYFRDQGKDVMLLFDSVTRFANAQREIGLAIHEPPTTRGYPPSVFALLPRLLERCGTSSKGTITGLFNILVEGDDMDEPISDAVRGILDGHIVLSRKLAEQYHYPAIDVLKSVSRLVNKISEPEDLQALGQIRRWLSLYTEAEDFIMAGAYARGTNPELDRAIAKMGAIRQFLIQGIEEKNNWDEIQESLKKLVALDAPADQAIRSRGPYYQNKAGQS